MKRFLFVLLLTIFILSGCVSAPGSSTVSSSMSSSASSSAAPDHSDPAASTDVPDAPEVETPNQSAEPGWQDAYLAVLNDLCSRYGKFTTAPDLGIVGGVKYARLLDFNEDGMRELVVLVDRSVQLYTCRDAEAVLLYEGAIGCRYGQTDVSYTFHVNALSSTPTVTIFHSENGWCEEAMTILHLNAEGELIQTEFYAATDGANDAPTRESLTEFQINGQTVEQTIYDAARTAALDNSTEIDVDWGAFPATREQLELLIRLLENWDDGSSFLLPDSDTAYLTEADLQQLTARQLRLARNEIYARHGRAFSAADLKAHFSSLAWYEPLYAAEEFDPVSTGLLNRYEAANLSLILAVESSGSYNRNAPDLSEEEALSIAEAYWDGQDGTLDSKTGHLLAISRDDPVEAGGRRYYTFRLRALIDNDHWATRDTVYVDVQTGAASSTLME